MRTFVKICGYLSLLFLSLALFCLPMDISPADGGLSRKGIPTFEVAQQKGDLPKRPPAMVKPEGKFSPAPQDGGLGIQRDNQIMVPEPPNREPPPELEDTGKTS